MTTETAKTRYSFSLWGHAPGWGYESGWCFGHTPEEAARDALASARDFGGGAKFRLPAQIHLQTQTDAPAEYVTVAVDAAEAFTVGVAPR